MKNIPDPATRDCGCRDRRNRDHRIAVKLLVWLGLMLSIGVVLELLFDSKTNKLHANNATGFYANAKITIPGTKCTILVPSAGWSTIHENADKEGSPWGRVVPRRVLSLEHQGFIVCGPLGVLTNYVQPDDHDEIQIAINNIIMRDAANGSICVVWRKGELCIDLHAQWFVISIRDYRPGISESIANWVYCN